MTEKIKNFSQRQKISAEMKKFYNISNLSYEDALNIIRGIETELVAILFEHQVEENDYRLGNATYGYDNPEKILNNLQYISDRWRAAFRITWMLGLINYNYR